MRAREKTVGFNVTSVVIGCFAGEVQDDDILAGWNHLRQSPVNFTSTLCHLLLNEQTDLSPG